MIQDPGNSKVKCRQTSDKYCFHVTHSCYQDDHYYKSTKVTEFNVNISMRDSSQWSFHDHSMIILSNYVTEFDQRMIHSQTTFKGKGTSILKGLWWMMINFKDEMTEFKT